MKRIIMKILPSVITILLAFTTIYCGNIVHKGLMNPEILSVWVKSYQKTSDTEGNFTGVLDNNGLFGVSVTNMGDLDGDGVTDLAVGAYCDDDGGTDRGAVWILFMNSNGTVKSEQKISDTAGNFTGVLDDGDVFGVSVTNMGDLNGDGVTDLAVGAYCDDDGGAGRGAVWILFMNSNGTVKSEQKISDTEGNFTGVLDNNDSFGRSVTNMGDLDGDGVTDLAVGAYKDDDGGTDRGAVWILFLQEIK
ncbi:integrin alpha [Spirochaetota bacterium]